MTAAISGQPMDRARCALLVVDFQARLMPVIEGAEAAIANAARLLDAAARLDVPVLFTEQNPERLGRTVEALSDRLLPGKQGPGQQVGDRLRKMTFDACRDGGLARLPDRPDLVVAGCEAHVCVLQTVLGLLAAGRRVFVVQDAVGSRRAESKAVALARMARHGAEIVTTEMAIFEWIGTADDARFRDILRLVR